MADKSDNPRSSKAGGSDSKKAQDAKTAPAASSGPDAAAEGGQVRQDLQSHNKQYLQNVAKAYQDASKKYLELLSRVAENLHKLQQDAAKSDPSAPFAVEVLRAYKTNDLKAVADAHRMLAQTMQNTTATATKRLGDALKAAQEEYAALCEDTRKELQSCAEQYSSGVLNTAKNTVPSDLDRTSAAVLGHSLLVSALIMPEHDRSEAA